MPTNEEVVKALGNMTVLEVVDLTKTLEEKWGVVAAPPPPEFRAAPAYGGVPVPTFVEQTEFAVVLQSVPADKKIVGIKVIRDVLGLALKEAKELSEKAPTTIKDGISRAEADAIKAKFAEQGVNDVVVK